MGSSSKAAAPQSRMPQEALPKKEGEKGTAQRRSLNSCICCAHDGWSPAGAECC